MPLTQPSTPPTPPCLLSSNVHHLPSTRRKRGQFYKMNKTEHCFFKGQNYRLKCPRKSVLPNGRKAAHMGLLKIITLQHYSSRFRASCNFGQRQTFKEDCFNTLLSKDTLRGRGAFNTKKRELSETWVFTKARFHLSLVF